MIEKQASGDQLDYRLPSGKPITGTLLWYYAICRREVWLMAHNIKPDEEHQSLEIGRIVHESFYDRMKREVEAEGMKIDVIGREGGVVYEVKTSSKFLDATKLQLGYYLWRLELMGVKATGIIAVPRERRKISVSLDNMLRARVVSALREISKLCAEQLPPPPVRIPFCRRCAYRDFCWGAEE